MDGQVDFRLRADPPADAICALLGASGLPTADIRPGQASQRFFGIECDGRWLAVIGLERLQDCALLRSLAVAPAQRGHGLGRNLVAHAENAARGDGIAAAYLLTTDAARYFARIGYREIAREAVPASLREHAQFRSLCPASAVVLVRRLIDG